MDFTAFDTKKHDEYAQKAKAQWGDTEAYGEYEKKTAGQSQTELTEAGDGLMEIFSGFGALKEKPASAPEAQAQVQVLQDYITSHFYTCTDGILAGLGNLYAADGEFSENIDRAGGAGTAVFAAEAIARYCGKEGDR